MHMFTFCSSDLLLKVIDNKDSAVRAWKIVKKVAVMKTIVKTCALVLAVGVMSQASHAAANNNLAFTKAEVFAKVKKYMDVRRPDRAIVNLGDLDTQWSVVFNKLDEPTLIENQINVFAVDEKKRCHQHTFIFERDVEFLGADVYKADRNLFPLKKQSQFRGTSPLRLRKEYSYSGPFTCRQQAINYAKVEAARASIKSGYTDYTQVGALTDEQIIEVLMTEGSLPLGTKIDTIRHRLPPIVQSDKVDYTVSFSGTLADGRCLVKDVQQVLRFKDDGEWWTKTRTIGTTLLENSLKSCEERERYLSEN